MSDDSPDAKAAKCPQWDSEQLRCPPCHAPTRCRPDGGPDVRIENMPSWPGRKWSGEQWWKTTKIVCPRCDFQIAMSYEKVAELILKIGQCEKENFKTALDRKSISIKQEVQPCASNSV